MSAFLSPGPLSAEEERAAEKAADDAARAAAEAAGTDPDKAARLARLARKAESARLARLRHKQFVQDKQNEVSALQREEEALAMEESTAGRAALDTARQELKKALTSEQLHVPSLGPHTRDRC